MTLSLAKSRTLRLLTFGALYLAQGLPFGLIAVGYLVLLSDAGRSNEEVGAALSWAYLPWSFKIFMASTNFCYAASARTGGWLADQWGFVPLFATAAAVQMAAIVLLPFCDERTAERRFRKVEVLA